ncbi:hypothetical protein ILYODFUR_036430 [Ilyodon furcidens]|uniref:Uncharacterized protein n=1 Tax=Ilyodon furcidens TaxID=33524 RepID=A0ABV0TE09_9TELE
MLVGLQGVRCKSLVVNGQAAGHTLDGSTLTGQHRDTQGKQPHMRTLVPKGNLERPTNLTAEFLHFGRKPEYPKRAHTCTWRTCKPTPFCCKCGAVGTVLCHLSVNV